MITHVVELEIKRFYRVFVEDEHGSMTDEELVAKAKEMAVENDGNAELEEELRIEDHDILHGEVLFAIDDE